MGVIRARGGRVPFNLLVSQGAKGDPGVAEIGTVSLNSIEGVAVAVRQTDDEGNPISGTGPRDGDLLLWDSTSGTWINGPGQFAPKGWEPPFFLRALLLDNGASAPADYTGLTFEKGATSSDPLTVKWHTATVVDPVPNAPTGLGFSTAKVPNPDTTSFRLTYTAATVPSGGGPVTAYRIYFDDVQVASVAGDKLDPGFGKPAYPIEPGTTRIVKVSAVNDKGEGPKSSPLTVTTLSLSSPPDAPVATSGGVTDTTATVKWGLVTYDKGAPTYEVYDVTSTPTLKASKAATDTSATITGLTIATSYDFKVKAVDPTNTSNKSAYSNKVTVTTTPGGGVKPLRADAVVDGFATNYHTNFDGTFGKDQTTQYAKDALQFSVLDLGCRYIRDAALSSHNTHIRDVQQYYIDNGGKILLHCGADRADATSQSAANTHVDNHIDATQWAGASYIAGLIGFENINEPNNDGDTSWAQKTNWMQQAWWDRTRLQNTGATKLDQVPIVGAGLANRIGVKDSYTPDYTALGDQTGKVHIGNIHHYPAGINPTNRMALIRTPAITLAFPSMPIWTTESGYDGALKTTKNNQQVPENYIALHAPKLLMEHLTQGSDKMFYYSALDEVDSTNADVRYSWGMVKTPSLDQATWRKKRQWYAMKRFLSLMADAGTQTFTLNNLDITVTPPTNGGSDFKWKLYQKRGGTYYVVMWRDLKLYEAGAVVAYTDYDVTVTLNSGSLPVAMHKPSSQGTQGTASTATTSTAYKTLTATSSFTVTMDGDLQVLVLG